MLDLVVVHPGAAHGIYGQLGDDLVAVEPPMWARIIAAYARERGYSVKIIDAEADKLRPQDVAADIAAYEPRLVCIAVYGHQPSASTQQMTAAGLTARAIKEDMPSRPIIMVGGHVAALTLRTMQEEQIDFACTGEGPQTIVDLIRYMGGLGPERADACSFKDFAGGMSGMIKLQDVLGLAWRLDGEIKINAPAPNAEIAAYSGDAWDLLPMDKYRAHNWQCFGDVGRRQPYASIYTTLGCPYRCSFCCINAPFGGSGYRVRDPDVVADEVARLTLDYGVTTFKIIDEMFVLAPRHYTAVAERLAHLNEAAGGKFNIWAYARVDTVKEGYLPLLRRAGIRWLALGIESGSMYVLDGAQKRLKHNEVADVVDAIQRAGINVIGNFIFGLPDDDAKSMRDTLKLAKSLRLDFANFYSAMAYPGSPLYDQARREGWTLPRSWRGYSQHNDDCRPLDTAHVGAREVLAFRDQAFDTYFRDPDYVNRVTQKFGRETAEHVAQMTTYKLKRKLLEGALT